MILHRLLVHFGCVFILILIFAVFFLHALRDLGEQLVAHEAEVLPHRRLEHLQREVLEDVGHEERHLAQRRDLSAVALLVLQARLQRVDQVRVQRGVLAVQPLLRRVVDPGVFVLDHRDARGRHQVREGRLLVDHLVPG